MRSDIQYINILKSIELLTFERLQPLRKPIKGGLRELYLMVAYEHYFPSPRAARSYIRSGARRLGLLRKVPPDAMPGNWAAFRVEVQQKLVERGLQLDLFEKLDKRTIAAKGKGQLGLWV